MSIHALERIQHRERVWEETEDWEGTHATPAIPPVLGRVCAMRCDVQGLNIPMVRRHTKGVDQGQHLGPQVQTVSGNYVAGKRKGVVDGVDLGFTGVVLPAPCSSALPLSSICHYTCDDVYSLTSWNGLLTSKYLFGWYSMLQTCNSPFKAVSIS